MNARDWLRQRRTYSLRRSLFVYSLTILVLGMGAAALLAWQSVERLYLETQRENLLAQARLAAAALQGQVLPAESQIYQQTSNSQPGIHTRLLSEEGAVVVSLPLGQEELFLPPAAEGAGITPQQLLARPEIAAALGGQSASAVRPVAGRRVLSAAAPVQGPDGQVSGLVYLATPLPASGLPLSLALSLAVTGLGALLLALGAGTLLVRRIISPVEGVARAAAAVSAGDLRQTVPTASQIRELDELALAFNHMTASLRQADQVKNAFIADVTHELRTPLTVIQGTLETLEDGALDDLEGRGPLLEAMQRESERLIRLVNDLLVLARANAGALNMEFEPLDLAELARSRCAHFKGLAARHGLQLVLDGAPAAWVLGDADRLAQVLDNLLDNAIRYSPAGAAVTVEIAAGADECSCTVIDRGEGISAQHLEFIFERFYRADASRNRQTGGAGLGLAIARALLQAQGGRIRAQSQPGQGTQMRFWLPSCSQKGGDEGES